MNTLPDFQNQVRILFIYNIKTLQEKRKKWWWNLFINGLNMAVVAAWRIQLWCD
jgi:hypothetical protein